MLAPKEEEWNSLQSAVNFQTSWNFVIKKELHFSTLYSILKWKGLNLKLAKHSIFLLTLLPPSIQNTMLTHFFITEVRVNSCPPANFWYLKISRANFDITWVFNTDIITRTGLKLTDFNSYDLEVGLELMKMLKLDESYVDEKITRDRAHDLTYYDVIK